ncbi:unnamed protein product [Leptidea sinapis]|uniref:Uncharacterized protein n=1 Tax=Leptidea sinapis TaxID=189913 RepID=A0A5E4QVP0_9NEOP|nr:unnamed protein product [Leptidea sinapis]
MSMSDVDPAQWWYSDQVVAEVNEYVDPGPMRYCYALLVGCTVSSKEADLVKTLIFLHSYQAAYRLITIM